MIDGVGLNGLGIVTTIRARSASAAGGRFTVSDGAGAPARTQTTGGVAGLSLEGMLALQGEIDVQERDRRARRHADAMLTELAMLQRAILSGAATEDTLRQLAAMAEAVPAAADPQLAAMIRGIVLRGRVELARRGMER
jgi:hypothetical protein